MSAQKFYITPFAASGDKAAIPDTAQGDGSMSYPEGYGADYERDPASDPDAKRISRDQMNELFGDITENLREYQIAGFPEWVTSAQNGGVPLAYSLNAYVRRDISAGGDGTAWTVYCSKVNNNTTDPKTDDGTHWAISNPVSVASLAASQTNVNEGDDDNKLVGPIELVRAAREGRWTFAGAVTYSTATALTAVLPGPGVYSQIAGAEVLFTVPTANAATPMTFKLGANAAAPLRTATGGELQSGDLLTGGIYPARYTGAEWRLQVPVASELRQYGAQGNGAIYGLIMSNAAGALTTAINVAAGSCRDSTNAQNITLTAPMTKRVDQLFAAGSGNGARDTGATAANQTWHVFVILNPATGAVDVLFSQSPTAPVLPGGFTLFRRVGAFLLDAASSIVQFIQTGNVFMRKVRSTDYAATANGGGPFLRKIGVPNGIKVKALMYFQSVGTSNDANPYFSGIYDPDQGSPAGLFGPATQWAQVRRISVWINPGVWNSYETIMTEQFTDTAQNVYTYSNDPLDVIALGVVGWVDDRGQLF